MKKNKLDNKFRHHKWFKEGVTIRYALDYFAKTPDFYLSQKPSTKQSMRLFDPVYYDDVITDGRCSYKLTEEEKDYYLERKAYWEKQKKIKHDEWLDNKIDIDKALEAYLIGNTHYDLDDKERQLKIWKNFEVTEKTIKEYKIDETEKARLIQYWENNIKRTKITKGIIDKLIKQHKSNIKNNKDFENFKKNIDEELSKVVTWNTDKADWDLIA